MGLLQKKVTSTSKDSMVQVSYQVQELLFLLLLEIS
jgi:hypothetical protein